MPWRDLVEIGKVGRPFGVKGEVRVFSFSESFESFERSAELFINGVWRAVSSMRIHKGALLARLEGVGDPEAARELTGHIVSVPRASLPPTQEDEHYWHDLIGMDVHTVNGANLGIVKGLIPTGANDVLEVNGPLGEVLLPMVDHVVLEVDTCNNVIIVDPLEGMTPES
jgi:16S rRNA processing protein RimM